MKRNAILVSLCLTALCPAFSQNEPPDTEIEHPTTPVVYLKTGQAFAFRGAGTDPEGDSLSYFWEFCSAVNGCQMEGKEVEFAFPESGVFEVICYAMDGSQEDPTPAKVKAYVFDENIPPRLRVTDPPRPDIVAYAGEEVHFQCEPNDDDGDPVSVYWTFAHDRNDRIQGEEMLWAAPAPGTYVVIAVVTDSHGAKDYGYRILRAYSRQDGLPPTPIINSPEEGAVIQVGESFSLNGSVDDPDSQDAKVSWLLSDGRRFDGAQVSSVAFDAPGRYEIRMVAADDRSRRSAVTTVYAISSLGADSIQIVQPPTDLRIQPGQSLYLEGSSSNASIFEKFFVWQIKDANNGQVLRRLHISRPGEVVLPEGEWLVTLFAVHPRFENQRFQSQPRRVVVKTTLDSEFSNNHSLATAAVINPGKYDNLNLGAEEFFKFMVPSVGQVIHVEGYQEDSKTEEALMLQLFDPFNNPVQSFATMTTGGLRFVAAKEGYYTLSAREVSEGGGYSKRPIGFGFGVSVLNPALYFPDVQWNQEMGSRLVVVNPFDESTSLEVFGYTDTGSLLTSVSLDLPGKGRLAMDMGQLFEGDADLVSWVRVDASQALSGMCITETRDGLEAYAVNGSATLSNELFIPHIAQQTTQWYTRGVIANGDPENTDSLLRTEAPQMLLDLHEPFQKVDFDFEQIFGGSLPEGVEWGSFVENESGMKLAAVEVFGKKDGSRQVAGLGLGDARQDNPNFFFIKQNLYFTHIARDTAQFWTGIAIVNVGSERRSFLAYAYDSTGKIVGQQVMSLNAGEKLVQLAEDFLDGFADVTEVDWVLIEADEGLVGYELFGTLDNKRLAGLEAGRGLKSSICLPFIDVDSGFWYGVSIVNLDTRFTNATFTLYDNGGNVLSEITKRIDPKQKYVDLLTNLFGPLPDNSGWVECSSPNGMLTGFELFGDARFEKMAAVLAQ